MATNRFTTIGISNAADDLLNQLHDLEGGQKRELVSNLLAGLLISEPGIIVSILNAGKSAMSAFNSGVDPVLGAGVTYPPGHFLQGFSATYVVETLELGVKNYRQKVEEMKKAEQLESEGKKKAKN